MLIDEYLGIIEEVAGGILIPQSGVAHRQEKQVESLTFRRLDYEAPVQCLNGFFNLSGSIQSDTQGVQVQRTLSTRQGFVLIRSPSQCDRG